MKHLQSSNKTAGWQIERAAKLDRACRRVERLVVFGMGITKATKLAARRYHHKSLRCDPSRRIALRPITLRRLFEIWKRGGRIPSALFLKYRLVKPRIPAPLLVRFVNYCSIRRQPSLKTAWLQFSLTGRNKDQAKSISYYQVAYSFSAADFYLMQDRLKVIATAQNALAQIRLKTIAKIRRRLPDKSPRRRGNKFQI